LTRDMFHDHYPSEFLVARPKIVILFLVLVSTNLVFVVFSRHLGCRYCALEILVLFMSLVSQCSSCFTQL